MKKLIFILIFLFAINGYCETEIYFSGKDNIQEKIIEKIDKAEQIIYVAMYAFNNPFILKALERVNDRGITVLIILDKVQSCGRSSLYPEISKDRNKWIVKRMRGFKSGIQHDKILIVDDKYYLTGSYNYTIPAENKNYENIIIIDDKIIIQKAKEYYNWLWEK